MVTLQLALHVDGQESLTHQYLRTGTLEVMIDNLHLVNLPVGEARAQLHGQVDTLLHVGMINQLVQIALHLITQLACFLCHLTTYRIDLHILGTKLFRQSFHRVHHHLDDVRVEATAERRVAGEHDQGHALHGPLLVVDGLRLSLCR